MDSKISNKTAHQNFTNVSPQQLSVALDSITKAGRTPDANWNNIPPLIRDSTDSLFTCIDYLKRFMLLIDHRVSGLTTSAQQSTQIIQSNISSLEEMLR